MILKIHLAMKYLGTLNTIYLVLMEHQQRKRKNTFIPIYTKYMLHKLNKLLEVKQGPSDIVLYQFR